MAPRPRAPAVIVYPYDPTRPLMYFRTIDEQIARRPSAEEVKAKLRNFDLPAILNLWLEQHPEIPRNDPSRLPKELHYLTTSKVTQAERVIEKFGGISNLQKLFKTYGVKMAISTIYRWTYSKQRKGTGGLIPPHMWEYLQKIARNEGVVFTAEDYSIEETIKKRRFIVINNINGQLSCDLTFYELRALQDEEDRIRNNAAKKAAYRAMRRELKLKNAGLL